MSAWQPVLEQLVAERHARLLARARLVAGPYGDAEDLVQEALVATFSARARFASLGEAEQYVRLAIVSRSADRGRRRAREARAQVRVGGMAEQVAPDPADRAGGAAMAALTTLSPQERACVVLRHLDDLSVRETALALGLSEGAVKRYTSDGVAALNEALGTCATEYETVPVLDREGGRRDA